MSDPKPTHDERWQQHFDDYCVNNNLGDPTGRKNTEAAAYADEMMEEEDDG